MDDGSSVIPLLIKLALSGYIIFILFSFLLGILSAAWRGLLNWFAGSVREFECTGRESVKQFPPESMLYQTESAGLARWQSRLTTVWEGDGPEVEFDYVDREGAHEAHNVHLTGMDRHPNSGLYIRGKAAIREGISSFKVSRIRSDIRVSGESIVARKFVNALQRGEFGGDVRCASIRSSHRGKGRNKPESKRERPDLPGADTAAARAKAASALDLDHTGWREEGLLSMSGYRVGVSRGRPRHIRHKILNTIVLYDDLSDVPDRYYASQWGRAGSRKRYKKAHDSLEVFLRNGERRHGPVDMTAAIEDWKEDLIYLERNLRKYVR